MEDRANTADRGVRMDIVGHGIDLVEIARVGVLLDRHGDRFLQRCFTVDEQVYATSRKRCVEHLAGRFAAKEAVLKVLGTGWGQGVGWTDAQILRKPTRQPYVVMSGQGLTVATQLGICHWWVSISHTDAHAMASVIGCRGSK